MEVLGCNVKMHQVILLKFVFASIDLKLGDRIASESLH